MGLRCLTLWYKKKLKKDLKLYPDDVWIATYPKSGTTWVQQIVRLIRNGGRPDDVKISVAVPWPEAGWKFPANLGETPRTRTSSTLPAAPQISLIVNTSA